MKAGNLVRITRASIACPSGTLGLIIKTNSADRIVTYDVQLANSHAKGRTVRRLGRDLEIVS